MRLLLLGTAVIIQDIRYLMWILEMITCLSTELREEHFTISWRRKNQALVCLWAAPKATAWPWYHVEAFLKHWNWEYVYHGWEQRGSSHMAPPAQHWVCWLCPGWCHQLVRTYGTCLSYLSERKMIMNSSLCMHLPSTHCCILPC